MYYFSCPSCTNNKSFYQVCRDSSSTWPGWGVFLFGGVLTYLLFLNHNTREQVQCANCGYVFCKPSMGRSSVATAALGFLYCILLSALFGAFVEIFPVIFSELSVWQYVETAKIFVSEHPTAFSVGTVTCVFFSIILALFITLLGNNRLHRQIMDKYECTPTEFPPQPAPEPQVETPPTHCCNCDYDLTGNESGVCPECGKQIV